MCSRVCSSIEYVVVECVVVECVVVECVVVERRDANDSLLYESTC